MLIDTNSQNNALYGNFIGTTASGNAALGNLLDGVAINGADFNSLHGCTVVDDRSSTTTWSAAMAATASMSPIPTM